MKNSKLILKYAGVVSIPLYIIFTFISYLNNTKINPLSNWLSDFGNPIKNPSGAIIYNMGCVIISITLAVFYIGIYQWYKNRKVARKYVICYICAQISGIVSSVFLILASIFPLGTHTDLHSTFSMINMIGIDCFLSFMAIALFMNPHISKWIGVTTYLIVVFNIVTTNIFTSFYIAEWIYFLLFMIFMVVIEMKYDKLCNLE